jgi:large subunit ribosomal protein L9
MDILLLEKVHNLGSLGSRVSVRAGYGRNYLIPKGKAVRATKENLLKFDVLRAELEKKEQEIREIANKRAESLNGLHLVLQVNASEQGKLYGSVGPSEIVDVAKKAGHVLEKKEILMPEGPIHYLGSFEIRAQLHSDVLVTLQLTVEST